MLYLINEYMAERNNLQAFELLKFESYPKYLHEMTIKEVNEIISGWNPVLPRTAMYTARKIGQYLEWLEKRGVSVAFKASELIFPIKKDNEAMIFSTVDIQKFYDILYGAIERQATLNGTNASTDVFLMTHAAGILAFYGLSDKQILDLDYSDVQPDGVRGYDLPLTQDDINVLMSYKNFKTYENRKSLKGEKYIRSVVYGQTLDGQYINRPLSRVVCEDEYKFVREILTTSKLNLFGKFNRVYLEEQKRGELIPDKGVIPEWFSDIFKVSINWRGKRRKEYISYRNARNECKTL